MRNLIVFFVLVISGPFIYACEPPPAVGTMCGKTKKIKYNNDLSDRLLGKIEKFEKEIREFIRAENPEAIKRIGDGSCFLMNSAQSYLIQLEKYSKIHNGQICQADFDWTIGEIQNLIDPKSEEIKLIKSEKFQKNIATTSLEIGILLREFKNLVDKKPKRR